MAGVTDWVVGYIAALEGSTAYLTILGILLVSGLGVPVPEDITLIAAGYLASTERITLFGATVAGFVGVLLADVFLFALGHHFGEHVFELRVVRRWFPKNRIEEAKERIHDNARFICFIARFLPGLRSPIYLTAGAMKVPTSTFIMQDGLAALVSVPFWVLVGWYFGEEISQALLWAKDAQRYLIAGLVVVVGGYIWHRHRRKES